MQKLNEKPIFYCQICKTPIVLDSIASLDKRVCCKECRREMEWRHALSIKGENYRMDTRKGDA